jgi:hypothetical protein
MTARQSAFLRWTEAAEAAEVCAYVELEREPQPATVRLVEGAGPAPSGARRGLWPLFIERFAGLRLKGNARQTIRQKREYADGQLNPFC